MEAPKNACRVPVVSPHFIRITLGFVAILICRARFPKSVAIAYTHFSVQGLLIALAGDAPATGAQHLPLALQLVFFPITMLPERVGIVVPYGSLLNSGFVSVVFLVGLRAYDRRVDQPGVLDGTPAPMPQAPDAAIPQLPFVVRGLTSAVKTRGLSASERGFVSAPVSRSVNAGNPKQPLTGWIRSLQASTTEIRSTQDGARYSISGGRTLWGIWMIAVAGRGFLGTPKTVYLLCLVTPETGEKFGGSPFLASLDTGRIKLVRVAPFPDEDGKALQRFVANVVQTAPRAEWEPLIVREVRARFKEVVPA